MNEVEKAMEKFCNDEELSKLESLLVAFVALGVTHAIMQTYKEKRKDIFIDEKRYHDFGRSPVRS